MFISLNTDSIECNTKGMYDCILFVFYYLRFKINHHRNLYLKLSCLLHYITFHGSKVSQNHCRCGISHAITKTHIQYN
jgi:hypothetical protein